MRVLAFCCLLFAVPAVNAETAADRSTPVTVLLDFEHPYSSTSYQALQRQLRHVLSGTGLRLDIRERKAAAPGEQFSDVLIFNMRGYCSMNALPVGALSDERGALAMAYSSEGNILPFGEVECDRVRQSLQRILGRGVPEQHQLAFGSALGLVMAHEIYHMLAHSAEHTRHGVTKESFSAREMLDGNLALSDAARLKIEHQSDPPR